MKVMAPSRQHTQEGMLTVKWQFKCALDVPVCTVRTLCNDCNNLGNPFMAFRSTDVLGELAASRSVEYPLKHKNQALISQEAVKCLEVRMVLYTMKLIWQEVCAMHGDSALSDLLLWLELT
jgi:hypothetical protein